MTALPAGDLLSIASDGRSLRKLALLNAAIGLFAERGYDRVSVRDIGETLHVTGPSLYRHYRSKSDLLADAVTLVIDPMLAEMRKIVAYPISAPKRLEKAIRFHVDFALNHRVYLQVYYREQRHLSEPTRGAHRRKAAAYRSLWVDLMLESGTASEPKEAEVLYALLMAMLNVGSPARIELTDAETVDFIVARASALLST